MKSIKEGLDIKSICEAKELVTIGSAYNLYNLIEFAANFNKFNSNNDEDWEDWEDVYMDIDWAMDHKDLLKKFSKVCKDLLAHTSFHSDFLGNFSFGDCELWELEEMLKVQPGDTVLLHTSDGDDGEFCWFVSDDKKGEKAISDFVGMVEGSGGWDPEVHVVPESDEDEDEDDD